VETVVRRFLEAESRRRPGFAHQGRQHHAGFERDIAVVVLVVSARSGRREAATTSPCTGFHGTIVSVLGALGIILSGRP
jgi:hypothetical protein